jgi:hypothetical protein
MFLWRPFEHFFLKQVKKAKDLDNNSLLYLFFIFLPFFFPPLYLFIISHHIRIFRAAILEVNNTCMTGEGLREQLKY